MTDAGLTGQPAKNDGGDYPAHRSITVHYGDRLFSFGGRAIRESGRSLRRFFRVPEAETLYLTKADGEPETVLDDAKTIYDLEQGMRFFSEPIPVPEADRVDFTDRTKFPSPKVGDLPSLTPPEGVPLVGDLPEEPTPAIPEAAGTDTRLSEIEAKLARLNATATACRTFAEAAEKQARANAQAIAEQSARVAALKASIENLDSTLLSLVSEHDAEPKAIARIETMLAGALQEKAIARIEESIAQFRDGNIALAAEGGQARKDILQAIGHIADLLTRRTPFRHETDAAETVRAALADTPPDSPVDPPSEWPPPMRDIWIDGTKHRLPGPWCHTEDKVKERLLIRAPARLFLAPGEDSGKPLREITGDGAFTLEDGQRFVTTLY